MEKILFEYTTQHGIFRDALYLPEDHGLTQAKINALKKERLNNWLYAVENPAPPSEETGEGEQEGVTPHG
jgi:hypothetical protein